MTIKELPSTQKDIAVKQILGRCISDENPFPFTPVELAEDLKPIFTKFDKPIERMMPRLIESVSQGIANTVEARTESDTPLDFMHHLPNSWQTTLNDQNRLPFAVLVGRIARSQHAPTDYYKQKVADIFLRAYPPEEHSSFIPKEAQEIIDNIQNYIPNNDILLFTPSRTHEHFANDLQPSIDASITHEFRYRNDKPIYTTHEIINIKNTLTLLRTTVTTEHGPWINYTILMDPEHDLNHDWRHGPKLSQTQNDLAILTSYHNPDGYHLINILRSKPWFDHRHTQKIKEYIINPKNYDSVLHWLNAVTRLGMPLAREHQEFTSERIDTSTCQLLALDLQRMFKNRKTQGPDDTFHRKEVFQQLITLIETNPDTAVSILTITGFLPQLVNPRQWNTAHDKFIREFKAHRDASAPYVKTNTHAFVEAIRDMKVKYGSEKHFFGSGIQGLIELVDGMIGTPRYRL
jgi:hypothetical protein